MISLTHSYRRPPCALVQVMSYDVRDAVRRAKTTSGKNKPLTPSYRRPPCAGDVA